MSAAEARKIVQRVLDDRITNNVTSDVRAAQIILALEQAGYSFDWHFDAHEGFNAYWAEVQRLKELKKTVET